MQTTLKNAIESLAAAFPTLRKRMTGFIVVLAACLAGQITDAQAVSYYVSLAGNDTNAGTSTAAPWKTISKVNTVDFNPGDKVFFRGGDTFAGSLYLDPTDAGTAASPVTLDSYGIGRAKISAGTDAGILVYNAAGISIKNLNFESPDRVANTMAGIYFYMDLPGGVKLNYINIDRVDTSGFNYGGIVIEGDHISMSGYSDVSITNVKAFNNVYYGILVSGYYNTTVGLTVYANTNVYIGNCRTYDNPGINGFSNHSGSGILLSQVDGGTIEKCIAYNNGTLSDFPGGGPVGIWAAAANNVLLQFNESHHNKSALAGTDGGGFDLDGGVTNSTLQYNYSHDNDGAGYLIYDYSGAPYKFGKNTIRYNISQNDGLNPKFGGIYVGGTNDYGPVEIYNNTLYVTPGPRGSQIGFQNTGMTGVHFRNNIVIANGGSRLVAGLTKTDFLMQKNDYWAVDGVYKMKWGSTTYTSYSAWQTASQQEKLNNVHIGLNVNPGLVSPGNGGTVDDPALLTTLTAYQFQSTSPLIDAGLDLNATFAINPGVRDFYAITTPQGAQYDLGAAEFSASAPIAASHYSFIAGSLVPTVVNSNFTAGNLARGSTFNSPATFTTDWVYAIGSQTPSTQASALAGSYFTVTLTPDAGVTYDLTSLTFDAAFYESTGASNTPYTTNYFVRSSRDNYATDIGSIMAEPGQNATAATVVFHAKTVTLSGAAFQNLTGPVTFRIYVFDSISSALRLSALDNLRVNAVVW